jgi:hypothetical protein
MHQLCERDLIVPSLRVAANRSSGESAMAELIVKLTEMFQPEAKMPNVSCG